MNGELLLEVMADKGISISAMCKELGIGRKAFWAKRKGISEFKQSEIVKIISLVGQENGNAIFFG